MVTLKFIAKKANVSPQTVSNVMNNKDTQVGTETKKRILDLIKEYNYTPSKVAKSLRRGSTKTIGLVVPDIVNYPVYTEIFDILEGKLSENDFNILLLDTRENVEREKYAISKLIENNVDGAIFIRIIKDNQYSALFKKRIPLVGCLRKFDPNLGPSVLTDNKRLGFIATEYLIKNGHRNILHFSGDFSLEAHKERFEGYKFALETYGIKYDKNKVITVGYNNPDLENILLSNLKKIKDFTAIFAYTDIIGISCIKILKILGIKSPDDVSIIGVDNLNIGNYVDPALTSMGQPLREICEKVSELLIEMIYSKEFSQYKNKMIYYEPYLIIKQSVKFLS